MLSAAQILAITVPELLFSAPEKVEVEYKAMLLIYHPDRNGNSDESKKVSQQINLLRDEAAKKILLKQWDIPGQLNFYLPDGKHYRIRFKREFDIGLGRAYVGNTVVAYVFPKDKKDLVDNGLNVLKKCVLPTDATLKKNLESVIPKVKITFEVDDKIVVVMEKHADLIRLRDAYDFMIAPENKAKFDEKFSTRHVAWVMSRCYYFSCFMESIGYGHHDISMDSVFIDPEKHTICVIGGWWYGSQVGQRMKRLQAARTIKYAPRSVIKSKMTSISTDLESIRLLGRELLNDPTGVHLAKNADVSAAMRNWLQMVSSGDARKDYRDWYASLEKAFGKRFFTVMDLKASEVYK